MLSLTRKTSAQFAPEFSGQFAPETSDQFGAEKSAQVTRNFHFDEKELSLRGQKFKDASIFYNSISEIVENDLIRWLQKSRGIQWDYKNIVKRKGRLERL